MINMKKWMQKTGGKEKIFNGAGAFGDAAVSVVGM